MRASRASEMGAGISVSIPLISSIVLLQRKASFDLAFSTNTAVVEP